eukprot:jgi/Bigna1/146112/aug1.109_g20820
MKAENLTQCACKAGYTGTIEDRDSACIQVIEELQHVVVVVVCRNVSSIVIYIFVVGGGIILLAVLMVVCCSKEADVLVVLVEALFIGIAMVTQVADFATLCVTFIYVIQPATQKSGHGDPNKLHYSPNFSYIWRIINSKIKENSTQRRHMKAKDALVLVKTIQRVGRELKQLRPDTVTLAFQNIPVLGLAVAIISFAEEAELRTLLFRVNLASAALGAGAKLFKASTVQGSTNTRNMYLDQLYNICKLIGQNQEVIPNDT